MRWFRKERVRQPQPTDGGEPVFANVKRLKDARDIAGLAALLRGDIGRYERSDPARALSELGAIEELVSAMGDANPEVRATATWSLWLTADEGLDPTAVDPLIALLADPSDDVRQQASEALARAQPPVRGALAEFVRLLRDTNKSIRQAAAQALGNLADPSTVDALGETLRTERESDVRYWLCEALKAIGDPRAIEALTYTLERGGSDGVMQAASKALAAMGPAGIKALTEALEKANADGASSMVTDPMKKALREAAGPMREAELGAFWDDVLTGRLEEVPEELVESGDLERLTDDQIREGLGAEPAVCRVALGIVLRTSRFNLFDDVVAASKRIGVGTDGWVVGGAPALGNYFEAFAQQGDPQAKKVLALLKAGRGLRTNAAFALGYLRGRAPKGSVEALRRVLADEQGSVASEIQKAIERIEAGQ